ncbi:YceI family protein [Sphingomonas cavernae]|uniref:Polyisoprenoid-binding protein n=1 Tax=Sphingomonas cavernae TaxID=2320861 RepID=A0A418WNS6_9SPHN|nr:YceI family protein [Sphingomonas cavernae]RJF92869.1 polyisoprenoid-binding protein [Sphingomonas cavernae]
MRRKLIALGVAVVAVVALPVIAQQSSQLPGAKNPAAVTGGTYTVDAPHTLVRWEVDHLGFTPYFGIFGDVTGTLVLDPKNPSAAKVDVTIPVAKVTTASAGLTKHLLKPAEGGKPADFFGANPADARFVSTGVTVDGDDAKITGNLTLNGVTKPVTLDAEFYGAGKAPAQMGGKENVGFEAETTIKRSDFGIGYGIPMVSDQVKLDIAVAFQK